MNKRYLFSLVMAIFVGYSNIALSDVCNGDNVDCYTKQTDVIVLADNTDYSIKSGVSGENTCTYTETEESCKSKCLNTGVFACRKNGTVYYKECGRSLCKDGEVCQSGQCKCEFSTTKEECQKQCKTVGEKCSNGEDFYQILKLASAASSIAVSRMGAAPSIPEMSEVLSALPNMKTNVSF